MQGGYGLALGLFHLAHEENIIVEWYPFRTPLVGYYWQPKAVILLSDLVAHFNINMLHYVQS
jgi:hypothetical protein